MLKIIGAKGNIKNIESFLKEIASFSQNNNIIIQVFNADMIYGKNHLISAYNHAKRAMDEKTNTTNSLAMEILLYASGERQLKLAIPKMGVKKDNGRIAFFILNENNKISNNLIDELLDLISLIRDDKIIEGNLSTLKEFGLKENEIKTVTKAKYGDLILEKVAMVDIIK